MHFLITLIRRWNLEDDVTPSPTPDDETFQGLARTWSYSNPEMLKGKSCKNDSFEEGITNGASWYNLNGKHISIKYKV